MNVCVDESWRAVLGEEFEKPYFAALEKFVDAAYAAGTCYPPEALVFNAFRETPFDAVKVVILGQDPYHNPGQAQGLAFSVPNGTALPPSLVNIFKELESEGYRHDSAAGSSTPPYPKPTCLGRAESMTPPRRTGDLTRWARQGVLLLNATLTVAGGDTTAAGSHQGQGWERFTDAVIRALASRREELVYLLWGSYAQKKAAFVDATKNLVLKSAHPSPLSAYRGFFGCGHFKACNDYLVAHGKEPIAW